MNTNINVIQCNGENCKSITVEDKDFYENLERKYENESGTLIKCNKNSNNSEYIECTIENKTSGFYTNSQKELIHCTSDGCSTIEPKTFEEITEIIPKYYINGNSGNDPDYPIIICQYSNDKVNKGCRIGKPFREIFHYDYIDQQKYPITFNNLFVDSGAMMSLISCKIILNGNTENQTTYHCDLINAEDYSYYITSKSESFVENEAFNNNIKASLIECIASENKYYSCKEYEKDKLGQSYYINTIHENKVIHCSEEGCITKIGINYYIKGCTKTMDDIYNGVKVNCYESISELIDCTSNKCKYIVSNNREIYIKGDGEGLILCENDQCQEIEGNKQEVFINGSTKDKSVKPIIVYEEEKWRSREGMANALYLNGNHGKNEKGKCQYSFIFCTTPLDCSEISGESGKKYINVASTVIFICNTEEEEEDKKLKSKNITDDLSSENYIKGYIVNSATMEILNYNNDLGILVVCVYDGNKATCSIN